METIDKVLGLSNQGLRIMKTSFGERLRAARKQSRIRQEELAEAIGVSQGYISDLERGQTKNPGMDIVIKLAEKLNISPGFLAFGFSELDLLDKEAVKVALRFNALTEEERHAFLTLLRAIEQKRKK